MGLKGLDDFVDDLRFDLLDRDDVSDARLAGWVNAAYVHASHPGVFPHIEMQASYDITLVQDQSTYGFWYIPVGNYIVAIRSMFHLNAAVPTATTEKSKLIPRHIRWFDSRTLSTGRPRSYAVDGYLIYVEPVPSVTIAGTILRVRYWQEPTALTGSAPTALPAVWDEIIRLGARWRAERDLGYREKAELTKQDYAALLNEYVERQDLEARDTGWEVEINHGDSVMEMT